MSEFSCQVVRVQIEPHPNADAIEIARVGDYQSIVRKGQLKDGDLAVYIPEQAVLPEWLLKEMNLWDEVKGKGGLAGTLGNRVKAIKLRGIVSQGLVLPLVNKEDGDNWGWWVTHPATENGAAMTIVNEGDDTAEVLGIVKYEPPIPTHMAGRIVGADLAATHKYDFENLKKIPKMFDDGEQVVITEKIHGTLICVGVMPESMANEKFYKGRVTLASKGLGAKGFILDHGDETNLYAQAAKKHNLFEAMLERYKTLSNDLKRPIFLMGEVFGCTETSGGLKGVQDLTYTGEVLDFRAFDICISNRGDETYLTWHQFVEACGGMGIRHVPVLYQGPYSKEVVLKHTDGPTTLAKQVKAHIREGVVVKSTTEARNPHYGRKIAKSVSSHYLLRKDATEFQ